MGFLTPHPLPVEYEVYAQLPLREKIRTLNADWVENGFGVPRVVHLIYILKVGVFYALGGLLLVSLTTDVGPLTEFSSWWDEPIVYEKLILWTVFVEVLGIGGAWGPLCGHFKPMTGGWRHWLRPGTVRLAPWAGKVPLTSGDTRTPVDVVLYAAIVVSLAVALLLPGDEDGLVRPTSLVPIVVLLVVTGLRDKVIFLAARGEQYVPAMIFMSTLGFVDMIIALKMLIVTVWVGAGVSKIGEHFINVVPPMVSNAPFNPSKAIPRAHYRNPPDDLLPSKLAWFMAHVGGTITEIIVPLSLLFVTNEWVVLAGVAYMVTFHLFITSTFPLAVPLEWNVIFAFGAVFLFLGHPGADGFWLDDFSQPWLLPLIAAGLVFFPILGNLRPDLVSFLPSMRQYAGNWACSMWAFAPGAEQKLNRVPKAADLPVDQLEAFGYDRGQAEVTVDKLVAFRALHSQGRGLVSLMYQHLGDVDHHTLREGEGAAALLLGWNFGDGHLHDERLIEAVQQRVGYAPGELLVVYVESQAIHRKVQEYRVIDAALGIVERGTWVVHDAVTQQPWLPNGPIPTHVTWTRPGYARQGS